jgi:tetraacyldisaccharide 4'-kinase
VKILDWRPWWVRLGTSLWGADERGAGSVRPPASWSGAIHDRLMARRLAAREAPPADLFVVSIGNLALGGTGKTPVTLSLAAGLADRGVKGAVLTRGFGSRLAGPLTVRPDDPLAGDEARLMAARLAAADWPVVQAQRRPEGLAWLREEHPGRDLVIAEDAHQTAGLGRHLDVVILDRWREEAGVIRPAPGPVVPFGPWRESARGADRAAIWVVEESAAHPERGARGQPVASFTRSIRLAVPDGHPAPPADAPHATVAGIARPEKFERGVAAERGRPAVLAVRPGDHAEYSPRSADRVARAMDASRAVVLVTTAKDWIKLRDFWPPDRPVLVAELDLVWGHDRTLPELVGERLDAWRG